MKITRENAVKLIQQTNGQIFSATFTKKNGELRQMNCRLGVTKHLKGGELAYEPAEYDLIPVFDVQKKAYRSISINTLTNVTIEGVGYDVL